MLHPILLRAHISTFAHPRIVLLCTDLLLYLTRVNQLLLMMWHGDICYTSVPILKHVCMSPVIMKCQISKELLLWYQTLPNLMNMHPGQK